MRAQGRQGNLQAYCIGVWWNREFTGPERRKKDIHTSGANSGKRIVIAPFAAN